VRKLIVLLVIFILLGCFQGKKIVLEKNGVLFEIIAKEYTQELEPYKYKVSGVLKIINKSDNTIEFSNRDLILIVGEKGESRTYIDSIASHLVDEPFIELAKNDKMEFQVYWELPPVKSFEVDRLQLEWRAQ